MTGTIGPKMLVRTTGIQRQKNLPVPKGRSRCLREAKFKVGTKWLFNHDPGIVLGPVDNRRSDEVSWPARILAPDSYLLILLFDLCKEALNSFILLCCSA